MSPFTKAACLPLLNPEVVKETPVTESEAQLIIDLRAGDERAFEQLVTLYERVIVRFLYRYLGNFEEAKELCQDVFLKVFRGLPNFQNQCSLKTWIYRIALNTLLNEKRRWYQRLKDRFSGLDCIAHTYPDSLPDPQFSLTVSERCRQINLALKKLRPEHRVILVLRDLEGLSYEEIAQALGLALGTVKSRLARARQEIKNEIQGLI